MDWDLELLKSSILQKWQNKAVLKSECQEGRVRAQGLAGILLFLRPLLFIWGDAAVSPFAPLPILSQLRALPDAGEEGTKLHLVWKGRCLGAGQMRNPTEAAFPRSRHGDCFFGCFCFGVCFGSFCIGLQSALALQVLME